MLYNYISKHKYPIIFISKEKLNIFNKNTDLYNKILSHFENIFYF